MKVSMHQVIDLNSSLNKLNEASHISFMDENKLRVSVPSNDCVHSNLSWQVEANRMLFTNETKLKTKHACEQVRFKSSLVS